MKTVHFFAFYPHNLPKITLFAPWSSMNYKIQNLHILLMINADALLHFHFFDFSSSFFGSENCCPLRHLSFYPELLPLFSGIKEIKFKNPTDNYLKFSSSFSAIHSNVFYAAPLQEQIHIKQLKIKHLTINKLPRILLCTCFCR